MNKVQQSPASHNSSPLLQSLIAGWLEAYPGCESRLLRGRDILLSGGVTPRGPSSFWVASSRGGSHVVGLRNGAPVCTCEDFKNRGVRCAHKWAASLANALAETVEGLLSKDKPQPKTAGKGGQHAAPSPRELSPAALSFARQAEAEARREEARFEKRMEALQAFGF